MVIGPLTSLRRRAPGAADIGTWPMAMLRGLRTHAFADRERWPLWLPVGFGTGIGLYFGLPIEPSIVLAALIGVVGLTCAVLSARSSHATLSVVLAAVAAISLGFALCQVANRKRRSAGPCRTKSVPIGLDGRIESVQISWQRAMRVVLSALHSKRLP